MSLQSPPKNNRKAATTRLQPLEDLTSQRSWWMSVKDWWLTQQFEQRQRKCWSKGTYHETAEPKFGCFDPYTSDIARQEALIEQALALSAQYREFSTCYERATQLRYLENLNFLEALDAVTGPRPALIQPPPLLDGTCHLLEVGVKNWSTLDALAAWAKVVLPQPLQITGVELDPYRRYRDGYSRFDYAQAYTAQIPEATYVCGDIRSWTQPASVIVNVLPFVFPEPHQAWGLPLSRFNPAEVFDHLYRLLLPGGWLLVFNQGREEAEAQRQLFAPYDFELAFEGAVPQSFYPYQYPRMGWWLRKPLSQD